MKHIDTVIIGGGQAALAMSQCLSSEGIDHVALERGRLAERWRSERWDSLHLLSPRSHLRFPGHRYDGPDQDGFMAVPEYLRFLEGYARKFSAPVLEYTAAERVTRHADDRFLVRTSQGRFSARAVVLATGQCDVPFVPAVSRALDSRITQCVPTKYRNPSSLPEGGVLVVGASATGIQLAHELQRAGRQVTLAVGRHTRLPRDYRGRDILAWIDAMGIFDHRAEDARDLSRLRRAPSLQLVGRDDRSTLDLGVLADAGVHLVGRVAGISGTRVHFDENLEADVSSADDRLNELLDRIDDYCHAGPSRDADRPARLTVSQAPRSLDLWEAGIRSVLWCTGFRQSYPFLDLPVTRPDGTLIHRGGVTQEKGLYALGLHWMRRRSSMMINGVGKDAVELTEHLKSHLRVGTNHQLRRVS